MTKKFFKYIVDNLGLLLYTYFILKIKTRKVENTLENAEIIRGFIEEKKMQNKSIKTLQNYTKQISYFIAYLDGKELSKVTRVDAKGYRDYMLNVKRLSAGSVNTAINSLKSLFTYMLDESIIDSTPFVRITKVDEGVREVVTFKGNQAQILVDSIDNPRDKVMVKFFLSTGLRSLELRQLKVEHLSEDMTVIGKGDKQRTVPVQSHLLDEVYDYLEDRVEESEYVFCTKTGGQIAESTLRALIKKYIRKAGLPDNLSTHKLRATYATSLYAQNVDTLMMQEILGHESLSTTHRYTKITKEQKLQAVAGLSFY